MKADFQNANLRPCEVISMCSGALENLIDLSNNASTIVPSMRENFWPRQFRGPVAVLFSIIQVLYL